MRPVLSNETATETVGLREATPDVAARGIGAMNDLEPPVYSYIKRDHRNLVNCITK